MSNFEWNTEKNEKLGRERGVVFEDVLASLNEGGLLDDFSHPHPDKRPNQRVMAVNINNYVYLVSYVVSDGATFLKTIIPSRQAAKKYLNKS